MKRTSVFHLAAASALLAACTSAAVPDAPATATATAPATAPAAPAAAELPDPAPDWRARVLAAKALDDSAARAEAMLALLREALPSRDVQLSGTSDLEHVHPDDNQPAPIVNFDPLLNRKRSARMRSGRATRSLQNNFGYYFSMSGVPYVVLGPAALDPRSPVFTKLAAEHELFHATNHVGDPRPLPDRELETWTTMFVNYFHDIHQYRQRWAPMIAYYDNSAPAERQTAIERLTAYYRQPPKDEATVRAAFEEWLARRKADSKDSGLIKDLEQAIAAVAAETNR